MSKAVVPRKEVAGCRRFSELSADEKESGLSQCRELTDGIYSGRECSIEVRAVDEQSLRETLVIGPDAFAVCHCGPGTEGGSGTCYVKFAAASSKGGAEHFQRLLDAVEAFAAARGLSR